MTTPIPPAAIDAAVPTSRSTFRLLAGCVDATNREADALRRALLEQWTDQDGSYELERQLRSLDETDPDGALGVEARLAVWFSVADPDDGTLVADDDSLLAGVSAELQTRLAGIVRPSTD